MQNLPIKGWQLKPQSCSIALAWLGRFAESSRYYHSWLRVPKNQKPGIFKRSNRTQDQTSVTKRNQELATALLRHALDFMSSCVHIAINFSNLPSLYASLLPDITFRQCPFSPALWWFDRPTNHPYHRATICLSLMQLNV